MGEYAKPIVGLRHSLGLRPSDEVLPQLSDDHRTSQRWRRWLALCRREHALLFLGGNLFTVVFITLMFYSLIGPGSDANGINVLVTAADRFGQVGGDGASAIFTFVGGLALLNAVVLGLTLSNRERVIEWNRSSQNYSSRVRVTWHAK